MVQRWGIMLVNKKESHNKCISCLIIFRYWSQKPPAETIQYLSLSEHPRLVFIQPVHMPDQQRAVHGMNTEQHVCSFIPLLQQHIHLVLHSCQRKLHSLGSLGVTWPATIFVFIEVILFLWVWKTMKWIVPKCKLWKSKKNGQNRVQYAGVEPNVFLYLHGNVHSVAPGCLWAAVGRLP